MSAKARAHRLARWLPVLLFFGFIAASAAVDTGATADSRSPVVANVAAGEASAIPQPAQQAQGLHQAPQHAPQLERAPRPIVIASLATQTPAAAPVAAPGTAPPLRATIAPLISSTPAPAPARFFTISEVMARYGGRAPQGTLQDNIQLAAVDPSATPTESGHGKGGDSEVLVVLGEPCGTRTHDPLIKRRGPAMSRPSVFLHSSAQPRDAARLLLPRLRD